VSDGHGGHSSLQQVRDASRQTAAEEEDRSDGGEGEDWMMRLVAFEEQR
jgi:hypothetical protein